MSRMLTNGESHRSAGAWQSPRSPTLLFLALTGLFLALTSIATLGIRPTDLSAQSIPSPYRFVETSQEAGVFTSTLTPDTGMFGFGPRGGRILGSHYQIRVGGPFGVQGNLGYLPTTRDVIDPRREEGDRKIGEADVTMATVDVRLQFTLTGPRTWYGFAPHLFAAGGAAFDFAPEQEIDTVLDEDDRFTFGPSFLGSFGGGIKWFLFERIAIRAEGMATYWKVNTPRGFLRTDRELVPPPEGSDEPGVPSESFWSLGKGWSVGIAYRF